MSTQELIPENLKVALEHGALKRLPVTFLPFANQQLREWDYLFPNERQSIERLLLYVTSLSSEQSSTLFQKVFELEGKMEVRKWNFSTSEQTIENSSLLARSPYYQEWRSAVQSVFDAADRYAETTGNAQAAGNRLVLLDIPRPLEVSAPDPWHRWQKIGQPIDLDTSRMGNSKGVLENLLTASPGQGSDSSSSLLDATVSHPRNQAADTWVIDADRSLVDILIARPPSASKGAEAILLSYTRLDRYRQSFSREMTPMLSTTACAKSTSSHGVLQKRKTPLCANTCALCISAATAPLYSEIPSCSGDRLKPCDAPGPASWWESLAYAASPSRSRV